MYKTDQNEKIERKGNIVDFVDVNEIRDRLANKPLVEIPKQIGKKLRKQCDKSFNAIVFINKKFHYIRSI